MSRGSMPAWAIASVAAFTISDSLVSPSSLPNLPWDQPTMQAVMELSSLCRHTVIYRLLPGKYFGWHRRRRFAHCCPSREQALLRAGEIVGPLCAEHLAGHDDVDRIVPGHRLPVEADAAAAAAWPAGAGELVAAIHHPD